MTKVRDQRKSIDDYEIYGIPSGHTADVDVIHVERIGFSNHNHVGKVRTHQHTRRDQYLFWRKGHGTLQLLDRDIPVTSPALVVMPMGHIHGMVLSPDTEIIVATPTRAFLIASAGPELVNRAQSMDGAELIHLSDLQAKNFDSAFGQLLEEYEAGEAFYLAACSGLMRFILTYIYRTLPDPSQPVHTETGGEHLIARFRALVETTFRQDHSIVQYAHDLAVSQRQLIRACQEFAGRSPIQFILDRRILEAQKLLRFTSLSISEIAADLRFHDASHFSRFFKSKVGDSPIAWRNRYDVSVIEGAR